MATTRGRRYVLVVFVCREQLSAQEHGRVFHERVMGARQAAMALEVAHSRVSSPNAPPRFRVS